MKRFFEKLLTKKKEDPVQSKQKQQFIKQQLEEINHEVIPNNPNLPSQQQPLSAQQALEPCIAKFNIQETTQNNKLLKESTPQPKKKQQLIEKPILEFLESVAHPIRLSQEDIDKLSNSLYYRKQEGFQSICEFLRISEQQPDFQSTGFQEALAKYLKQSPAIKLESELLVTGVIRCDKKKGNTVDFMYPSDLGQLSQIQKLRIIDGLTQVCLPQTEAKGEQGHLFFNLTLESESNLEQALICQTQEVKDKENKSTFSVRNRSVPRRSSLILSEITLSQSNQINNPSNCKPKNIPLPPSFQSQNTKEAVHKSKEEVPLEGKIPVRCRESSLQPQLTPLPTSTQKSLLFGISVFQQNKSKTNEDSSQNDNQKAIFLLSSIPIQGYLLNKLQQIGRAYFSQDDGSDYSIIENGFKSVQQNLKQLNDLSQQDCNFGSTLRTLFHQFKLKAFSIFKALLLQKKIVIYSKDTSSISRFIQSLISLLPGQNLFQLNSQHLDCIHLHLNSYGLPFRIFNDQDCLLIPFFTMADIKQVQHCKGYLIGSNDDLVRQYSSIIKAEVIVNLDNKQLIINDESLKQILALNADEKRFAEGISRTVDNNLLEDEKEWKRDEWTNDDNNNRYLGSDSWIREQFQKYIFSLLSEIELCCQLNEQMKMFILETNQSQEKQIDENTIPKNNNQIQEKPNNDIYEFEKKSQEIQVEEQEQILNLKQNDEVEEKEKENDIQDAEQNQNDDKIFQIDNLGISEDCYLEHANSNPFESEPIKIEQQQPAQTQDEITFIVDDLIVTPIESISTDEDASNTTEISFEKIKMQVQAVYKKLSEFNLKFLKKLISTQHYKYWMLHHDSSIALRSFNNDYVSQIVTLFIENGSIFSGSISKGKRQGKGVTYSPFNGVQERCEKYEDDYKNGLVIIESIKNDFYFEGQFQNDLKEGFGNYISANVKYSGHYKSDKYHGQGSLVDKDKSIYEGEFKENMKFGMGKYKSGDNTLSFVGEFQNNQFNGQGQLLNRSGEIYCGDFKNGLMHGQGEYIGKEYNYTGEYDQGSMKGQGIYKNLITNDVFQGEFIDGQLDCTQPSIIKYNNGDVYSGPIKNWQPEGEGLLSQKDGTLIKAIFSKGEIVSKIE